jgi:hypothetical protein
LNYYKKEDPGHILPAYVETWFMTEILIHKAETMDYISEKKKKKLDVALT